MKPFPSASFSDGIDECYVPHVGWLAFEPGDAVLRGLREGDFEFVEQAALLRLLRPGDVFVDAGAHAGLYTLLAAGWVGPEGRIVAVEPSPSSHALLAANTAALDPARVSLHACALAREDGDARLLAGGPGLSAYNRVEAGGESADGVLVAGRSLSSLLSELRLAHVDLLKLDVEGSEIAVLEGAHSLLEAGAIRMLLVEFNEENLRRTGGSCESLAHQLTARGYRLYALDHDRFEPVEVAEVGQERYANYLATKDEAAMRERFDHAGPTALRAATEILRRGALVHTLRGQAQAELAKQHAYIEGLKAELRRLESETSAAKRESTRLGVDCQRLLAEQQEAGIIAQQHIDRLITERKEARDVAQTHIEKLLADGRHYAKVIAEQDAYIGLLIRERDQLRAGGKPPHSESA